MLVVDRHEGHFARPRPRRQNDMVGRNRFVGHDHTAFARKTGLAAQHIDLVLLQQEPDALAHRLRDAARTGDDTRHIGLRLAAERHAESIGRAAIVVDLRAFEQCLGGDTPPVEADASQLGAFDERRLAPQFRGSERSTHTARAAADHQNIVMVHNVCIFNGTDCPLHNPSPLNF